MQGKSKNILLYIYIYIYIYIYMYVCMYVIVYPIWSTSWQAWRCLEGPVIQHQCPENVRIPSYASNPTETNLSGPCY